MVEIYLESQECAFIQREIAAWTCRVSKENAGKRPESTQTSCGVKHIVYSTVLTFSLPICWGGIYVLEMSEYNIIITDIIAFLRKKFKSRLN